MLHLKAQKQLVCKLHECQSTAKVSLLSHILNAQTTATVSNNIIFAESQLLKSAPTLIPINSWFQLWVMVSERDKIPTAKGSSEAGKVLF